MIKANAKVAVLGLGYVGLPLAVAFSEHHSVIGFDLNELRIQELQEGCDSTLEVDTETLRRSDRPQFTSSKVDLAGSDVFIVTVPTPVDKARRPDLEPLRQATEMVGCHMGKGATVIFESTVYPGCTREFCVPILERMSGLTFNEDFYVGYSPERANPGDRAHSLTTIQKVTSGSTPEVAAAVDALYASIVPAGTFSATTIEVAEAAKVIENTQRDLNVALMNELAVIFDKLGIDTIDVLEAAETKWNFLPFRPGLVGGHCIGVDPYYLTHRAEQVGYHPQVILAGRRINDSMGSHIGARVAKGMMQRGFPVVGSRILILGLTFKEDCPDLRNSRVPDIIESLREFNAVIEVYDPWANSVAALHEYGINLLSECPGDGSFDAIILAVPHGEFVTMGADAIRKLGAPEAFFFDVKAAFARRESDGRL